ncbi:HD domain-containing protein [soil metagenome]
MHRVAQFVAHVRARVEPEEEAFVRGTLPDAAATLFATMPVADRRHALDVAERLVAAGHDDPDLLAAALLHDAAKGHRMRLVHRVSGVLLESFAPRVLRRLAEPDPSSWRHPFHLYLHHAPMSARLAERAGCGPRAAAFIRGSSTPDDERLLRALKAADDRS